MGWTYTQGASMTDVIDENLRDFRSDEGSTTVVGHELVEERGEKVLWIVREINDNPRKRIIECVLLDNNPKFGWGCKVMDETMRPFYYSCPLRLLDLAADPEWSSNEQVVQWRNGVRSYHRKGVTAS